MLSRRRELRFRGLSCFEALDGAFAKVIARSSAEFEAERSRTEFRSVISSANRLRGTPDRDQWLQITADSSAKHALCCVFESCMSSLKCFFWLLVRVGDPLYSIIILLHVITIIIYYYDYIIIYLSIILLLVLLSYCIDILYIYIYMMMIIIMNDDDVDLLHHEFLPQFAQVRMTQTFANPVFPSCRLGCAQWAP